MRGLWCVASFATANSSSNNVSSVLTNLDVAQPSATPQNDVSANQIASAISNAISSQSGSGITNPISIGQLIQSAVGDGTNPGVLTYLNQLGVSSDTASSANKALTSATDIGVEKTVMNPTDQLDLAQSVLTDSTSLMNQSSLVNLFPALTGGVLTNSSAGNLLGVLNNGNTRQILSTISGVMTNPQLLNSAASLTNSPALQGASAISNIGSSVASGINIGNALAQNRALLQSGLAFQPTSILSAQRPTHGTILESRRLADSAGGLDLSTLTNSLLGGTSTGGLNLGSLASSLLGGSSSGGLNLSSLTGNLLGGTTSGTTNTGLDLASLTNSLQSLTGSALGAVDSFQALTNSTTPLQSASAGTATQSSSSNTLQGVAATFITNNYLNPAGQVALKSTAFAQKALQYPDLVAVLNGQSPINSADGQLTQVVQTALRQMNISATTPAALISTICSTDSQDQSTNLLVNPLSNLATNTSSDAVLSNANSILEESQKALQDSLTSITNGSAANTSLQDALNSLTNTSNTNNLLTSLLQGTLGQTRVLEAESTASADVESTTAGQVEGLRNALVHFNEALKKAIQANEEMKNAESETSTPDAGNHDVDEKHRKLDNWFSSAWDKIKNTFNGDYEESNAEDVDWKTDVNDAAQQLANNLSSMADKIRGTDVADMIDNWFEKAKDDLASKANEITPHLTIGSVSDSPSRGFSGISQGASEEVASRRRLASLAKDGAFSVGHDNYNFQSVIDKHPALASGVEGYNFQSADDNEVALSAGYDEYNFQQALGGNLLGTDLLGSSLFPANGMFAGIQPVINSLTSPFLGAINSLGTGNGANVLQNNPLQQLLNNNANSLRLFQEDNHGTEHAELAGQGATVVQSYSTPDLQQLQKIALMLQQLQTQSNLQGQPSTQVQPSVQAQPNVQASPSVQGQPSIQSQSSIQAQSPGNSADSSASPAVAASAPEEKTLNSIDVKEWINKLSDTELGKTFGLDQLDLTKLPVLPDIKDDDLENFLKNQDWENVFNALRLSDLPGLQGENESTLRQQVKDGKLGEILAKVDLSNLPGLESIDVNSILKHFNEAQGSTEKNEKQSEDQSGNAGERRLQNSAANTIANGASSLTDTLTSGATSSLLNSQQSLLNQLQGITSLADGLTGLTSGLGYGLTNLNANALTGTNLLTSGIGSLLGNVNSGLGTNLNNLGSGLSGLTSSIGTNLGSGLGSTASGLGSGQLNLFDLSGLASLIPTNAASTLSDSVNAAIQPTLSSYNLTSVDDAANSLTTGNSTAATSNQGTSNASTSTLDTTDLNALLNSLSQTAAQAATPATSTTSDAASKTTSSPGTALQILHAFVGMRRMLNTVANSPNSSLDLLNALTTQLTGNSAATNSSTALLDSLSSSLGLGSVLPSTSATSLDTLLNTLNSNLASLTQGTQQSNSSSTNNSKSLQSAASTSNTAASSGVAVPDLQSILGGSYKQLQSATSASDSVTSLLGNTASGLPDLSSLLGNTATSLPDVSSLLSSTSSLPDLNSIMQGITGNSTALNLNSVALPSTNDLLSQLSAGTASTNLTDTLNQSLASLTGNSSTNDLTNSLTQSLNSLSTAANAGVPDLSSLLQVGSTSSNLNDLTSNLLAQLSAPTAAPTTVGSVAEKAGTHVMSALKDMSSRRLLGTPLADYLKEIEREEVLAEGMLSNDFRQKVAQIKQNAGSDIDQAKNAQMQIAVLEADYKSKMAAVSQLSQAQKVYATNNGQIAANAKDTVSNANSGQATNEKTPQSSSAVVVAPIMGNAVSDSQAVSRRLLLSDRVINLDPNSAFAGVAYVTSTPTPEPEFHPDHTRAEEWIEDYIPPVLKSVLNMINPVEDVPPAFISFADHKSSTPAYRTAAVVKKSSTQPSPTPAAYRTSNSENETITHPTGSPSPYRTSGAEGEKRTRPGKESDARTKAAEGEPRTRPGSAESEKRTRPGKENATPSPPSADALSMPLMIDETKLDVESPGAVVRNLQLQSFRNEQSDAAAGHRQAIAAANNLPAIGSSVLSPSYSASWQPNGVNRFSGFYPYGSGDSPLGSVSGSLGFDLGQFPVASAISSANQVNVPAWPGSSGNALANLSQFNPYGNQFLNVGSALEQINTVQKADAPVVTSHDNYSPILGERFDPISILTAISNSDLDVPGLFQILANSNVDWNGIVTKLRNGSTFESLVPEMIKEGLDVPAILALVNKSNLNLNNILHDDNALGTDRKTNISTLEDLLAQLDGLDLNALIKSTAETGIDLKSVILMLSKDGVDLQSVADSEVMPIIGEVAAVSQLEDAFEPHADMIDPHALLHAMENAENELAPL